MSDYEEPNLFLRKQDGSDFDEKWDDSEIIAAYDKAVLKLKRKTIRKIQRELGLKDEDVEEFLVDLEPPDSKPNKKGKNDSKKKTKKWTVGSSCRAVFSEDGEEYEAVVVKILDSNWCIVRYVGYENEEEVLLEDLGPSLGKAVIQAQIEAANNSNEVDESDEMKYEDKFPKSENGTEEVPRFVEGHSRTFEPSITRFPMSFPVPPPPPAPPGLMTSEFMRTEDGFHSMLMSWYMCGYYTGLYERGQQLWKK